MYTRCPHCDTWFRIAAADLEVAEGRVRCSRCEAVFDAREQLTEDDAPEAVVPTPAGRHDPQVGDLFEAGVDGPEPPVLDPGAELDGEDDAPLAVPAEAPAAADADLALPDDLPILDDLPPLPVAGTRRPDRGRAVWSTLSVLLGLSLAAQTVHAFRGPLARDPTVGPLVQRAYHDLGLPIVPPRDLSRIALHRTEVTTHPLYDHVLMLTGVLTDDAGFPQPFPLLRVRLEDRWGQSVGYRMFSADEYLRTPAEAQGVLEPGRDYAISLEVVDPGSDAVGYSIEPCLRVGPALQCAGPEARD